MRSAALIALALALAACARDPAMLAWEADLRQADRTLARGDLEAGLERLRALERTAPRPSDATSTRFSQARALEALGRLPDAVRLYLDLARGASRQEDRARARYEVARIAEEQGHTERAMAMYRALVLTYPDLMPGLRSFQRLRMLHEEQGEPGVRDWLTWTLEAYPKLEHTRLADNLVYDAGVRAYRQWQRTRSLAAAQSAERLFLRLQRDHWQTGSWDEGLWHLSWLYHGLGRHHDEVVTLRKLQQTRQKTNFIGNYEHTYYWVGQMRIARLQLLAFGDPAAAADSYAWFLAEYPKSRWRDDALFWQGCAWLRAGEPARAEASFARIPEAYEHSKYLERLDAARSDPAGAVCDPAPFTEDDWP